MDNKQRKFERFTISCMMFLLQVYRRCISPALGPRCRFYPSCSQYSMEALQKYGALKGTGKIILRLCKCHPLHKGGIDFP